MSGKRVWFVVLLGAGVVAAVLLVYRYAPPDAVSAWSGTLNAVVVGTFTLIGSWLATTRAHNLDQTRRREEAQNHADQLLRAIRAELNVARERYMESIGQTLEKASADQPFTSLFFVSEKYLSVYESAGPSLGLVQDADTVEKVVYAYTTLRSLIDTYRMNNQMVDRHHRLAAAMSPEAKTALSELREYAPALKTLHYQAMNAVDEAQTAIQYYLGEPYHTIP